MLKFSCSFYLRSLSFERSNKQLRSLHPWVKVDQAGRPLPSKSPNILVGLTLKLDSLCIVVIVVEKHLDVLVCFYNILCC